MAHSVQCSSPTPCRGCCQQPGPGVGILA